MKLKTLPVLMMLVCFASPMAKGDEPSAPAAGEKAAAAPVASQTADDKELEELERLAEAYMMQKLTDKVNAEAGAGGGVDASARLDKAR